MARKSEFSSYVFIRNDLSNMGWNIKNPLRSPGGRLFTQQECLDVDGIKKGLVNLRPEYVLKIDEENYWLIEAKGDLNQISLAVDEACEYARKINSADGGVKVKIVSGVAGNESDGYLVKTYYIYDDGSKKHVTYNSKDITGFLSPSQSLYLTSSDTHKLNDLVVDENLLLDVAEGINETLHKASINKDLRATVMSSVLLAMVSDTLPNFNASPEIFIKDINNRAEDVLIHHAKRELSDYVEIKLPKEDEAKEKFKSAIVKVFFLLRKINVKAAMDGSHDLLGKFYEVFLKYGNGAKDIGIVLTPRHITEFASYILDIKSSDLVYDPACGTGGFLVAAYDYVRVNEPDSIEMFKKHRIFGVEQQANVAALAVVNMIFRGDGKNNIINNDCLHVNLSRKIKNGDEVSAEYQSGKPDRLAVNKVMMNPPFALKNGDEQEFVFIDHALEQMVDGGLLFCVIPSSVMYASKKELSWRKRVMDRNSLLCSMTISNELFYPQASVEPVLIVMRKGVPQSESPECLFVKVENDGFYKKKRRRVPSPIPSDLHLLKDIVRDYIFEGRCNEIEGVAQVKEIDLNDKGLEIIPQNYLGGKEPSSEDIKSAMAKVQSELIFQMIKKEMQ